MVDRYSGHAVAAVGVGVLDLQSTAMMERGDYR
jgi:hypothetical protein